jgi:hypothetical protein
MKYAVRIEHDPDVEAPESGYDGWRLYSFNTRHLSHKGVDELFEDGKPTLALRNKLRAGLAHFLSYYEHGQCCWMLAHAPHPAGVEFQWDGVRFAGVAVWTGEPSGIGAKTPEERAKDCQLFLSAYTDWCNGNCYWYSIRRMRECPECGHEEVEEDLDSCGGYIGDEDVAEAIKEALPDDATAENTKFTGDGAWLVQYHDVFKPAKVSA